MSDQTSISIRRMTSYPDYLRSYKVVLDGALVGTVRAHQTITIPTTSGTHSLALHIDWCGSEEIPFDAQPGEHVIFECGSNLEGWRIFLIFFYILFRTKDYLWLRRTA